MGRGNDAGTSRLQDANLQASSRGRQCLPRVYTYPACKDPIAAINEPHKGPTPTFWRRLPARQLTTTASAQPFSGAV